MKKLLILSGKGGTGKTTTAAAFIEFSKAKVFADCDVDAPNLHLVTNVTTFPIEKEFYGSEKAHINSELCKCCGKCKKACQFDAITMQDKKYQVNQMLCEGCGVCTVVCPDNAISMADDISGKLMLYKDDRVFSTAQLKMGRGNSGKLVSEVKSAILKEKEELAIIDGSPGIGCPVIASISGVDLVLIVAEPSLSGISDMKRIIRTCRMFGVDTVVCINKYDTCPDNTVEIEKFLRQNQIRCVGTIPFDETVSILINEGKSVAESDCPAGRALKEVYRKTIKFLIK